MPDKQQSPAIDAMDFVRFFADIYDEFTGSTSTIEERGKIRAPDGNEYPNLVQVSVKNPNVIPICNDTGAQYLIHHIRLIFNKHTALGALTKDEIAEIAGNKIMQPINTMMFNRREYGVSNLEKLETEGLALFDTLYVFLTALKETGNIRGWIGDMYRITVETREQAAKAQAGLLSS